MRALLAVAAAVAFWAAAAQADVYFVEEIVNPGFGAQKLGARRTRSEVYIKDKRQKVSSTISTTARTAQALRDQGHPLESSTILRLDDKQVFEIDLESMTYVQKLAPPPDTLAAAAPASARPGAPQVRFAVKEMPDSAVVAGIPCRRVVAQMRAQYLDPETGAMRRENRYTYDAYLGRDFPGHQEIVAFQQLQAASTSYPPLITGGLEQVAAVVEDVEQLETELAALQGFPLRSTIRVTVVRPDRRGESEVFRLEREVKEFRYYPLADSVFAVPKAVSRVSAE